MEATVYMSELTGADLSDALCYLTIFADVDLSDVKGLNSIRHLGPSTIGIDTVLRSSGKIPEDFLRGCGAPMALIESLCMIVRSIGPIQFYSCFVSYSSRNHLFAKRLHSDLQEKGIRCWFDKKDLKPGDKIRDRITDAILGYDKFILILSKDSIESDWVEGEVEAVLARERKEKRSVLFPIRLDDAVLKAPKGWASHIHQTRSIGDFRGWTNPRKYQTSLDDSIRNLRAE
jgi:hypothetical protein